MALPQRHPIRILRRQRRPVAAVLAAAAVLFAIQAARPAGGQLVEVVIAARAIPAGATITSGDLDVVAVPAPLAPTAKGPPAQDSAAPGLGHAEGADLGAAGTGSSAPRSSAVAEYVGSVSAVAIAAGEQLSPVRLLSRDLAADPAKPDNQPMPLRLPDNAAAALLRPGNRIDVIAAASAESAAQGAGGQVARIVARGVLVLSLMAESDGQGDVGPGSGTLALLSVSEREAVALSQAQAEGTITFTVAA